MDINIEATLKHLKKSRNSNQRRKVNTFEKAGQVPVTHAAQPVHFLHFSHLSHPSPLIIFQRQNSNIKLKTKI